MRLKAEARARWRAWLGVALLIGALFGSSMAAAAGARRTGSVVARARASEQAPDVYLVPAFSDNGDLLDFESIAQLPEVIEAIRVPWLAGSVDGAKLDVLVLPRSMLDGKRLNIVSGRAPRGGGEAAVNFLARDALGWPAGTSISVDFAPLRR